MARLVRGMRDVLPDEAQRWRAAEERIVAVIDGFAYEELRLPLLEMTELFARSVGASTDIVEKEMYSLIDRDGSSISLRPEGTASCARALLEGGLLRNQSQRVYYRGPMFRHERPQLGRFRQFHQIGVEAFGPPGPDVDAELIQMGTEIWRALGLADDIQLELNTLGAPAARAAWRDALAAYLRPRRADLDADSARRLDRNPLRILDSKSKATQALLADAPRFDDYIDDDSAKHFEALKGCLMRWASPMCPIRAWCAAWTTTAGRCSSGPRPAWAPKARCAPAGVTMAWLRSSAASRPRRRALPWGWSVWCCFSRR